MSSALTLPPRLVERPLVLADARAVFEGMAAQEPHDLAHVEIEGAVIVAGWQGPSCGVSARTVGVLGGDRLVASAEMMGGARGDAAVHPEHRGRGIGSALARWM